MRRLILAEKYSAARRLARILSGGRAETVRADGFIHFTFSSADADVIVFPLRGHVVEIDYPDADRDWRAVDPESLIDTEPVRREAPAALHDALRRLAETTDEVVIATDYDREGELIGIEALETLRAIRPGLTARRARFSAMTAGEVRLAFQDLAEPDWALAEAAAARQRIDLAWGAVLTRFLTLECGSGRQVLSAGRVQTPTLRLVGDRERDREAFVPRPFWNVLLVTGEPPFEASAVSGPFWDEGGARALVALASLGDAAVVGRIERRDHREPPPAPFNTTSFLAEASRVGIGPSRAMVAAQELYVRGEISYPRTDNTVYPPSLPVREILKRLRESPYRGFVDRLLAGPHLEATRGPVRTTDHPPIHPTAAQPAKRRTGLRSEVFDLITRRFLATFSPPSVSTITEVHLRLGDTEFLATGRRIVEPGWREIVPDEHPPGDLPAVREGEGLPVCELRIVEDRTKPPPLHTSGTLLLTMQRLGLGTKSTRHEILDLLYRRQYVSGRSIRMTAAGRALVDALAIYGPDVTAPEMTRDLEDRMTAIAEGRATLADVVRKSREDLHAVLAELRAHRASLGRWVRDATFLESDYGACDACGEGRLVRRRARNGWSFLGCTRFPACRNRQRLNSLGQRSPWKETATGADAPESQSTTA
ncbi:MAG TPA: DNA topoisomerase [Thermoplasmata archaeon]